MDHVKFGKTGLGVSRLCIGCMSYGIPDRGPHPWTLDEEKSRPLIKQALELGINFFDTANVYSDGTSEEIVGRALKEFTRREDVVIATKVNGRMKSAGQSEQLPVEGPLPSLSGAVEWLNSKPLTADDLKGKVVLVDFWTYSCINCLRSIPYIRAWAEKYRDHGLVVIGVHAPEFAFERNVDNVKAATSMLKIGYPVAIDNEYKIWRAFENEYWPAHYFIDAQGLIRHHHFGEGEYDESERVIQKLLTDAGDRNVPMDIVAVNASGAEAASAKADVESPETYIGYDRIDHFVSPGGVVQDASHVYAAGSPQMSARS